MAIKPTVKVPALRSKFPDSGILNKNRLNSKSAPMDHKKNNKGKDIEELKKEVGGLKKQVKNLKKIVSDKEDEHSEYKGSKILVLYDNGDSYTEYEFVKMTRYKIIVKNDTTYNNNGYGSKPLDGLMYIHKSAVCRYIFVELK